jgi:hypothetical protein
MTTPGVKVLAKLAALTGWLVCTLALIGWLALAVHRHHLAGIFVTATALAALVVLPPLARGVNPPPE